MDGARPEAEGVLVVAAHRSDVRSSGRERFEQVGAGDDPLGRSVTGHEQRLLVADQELDRGTRRIVDRYGRERWLHHLLDRLVQ